jgi:hypothetical protein
MFEKPVVSLHGSGEEIVLSHRAAEFVLMQGSTGLGWGPQEITTSPLASGGSVLRHRRTTEADVVVPFVLSGNYDTRWNGRRRLERLCDDLIEIRVTQPGGDMRSRYGYYADGLQGDYGAGEDSYDGQKLALTIRCPDPWWHGGERKITERVDTGRKPFITSRSEELVERKNLAWNPSFESDVSQFSTDEPARNGASYDTTWAAHDGRSLRLSASHGGFTGGYYWSADATASDVGVLSLSGLELTVGFDYKRDAVGEGTAALALTCTLPSDEIESVDVAIPAEAGEGRIVETVTLPEGASDLSLRFLNESSTAVWVDGLTIEEGTTDGTFFDGDTPDGVQHYAWLGDEHASPSTQSESMLTGRRNLAQNPSMWTLRNQRGEGEMSPSAGTAAIVTVDWAESGTTSLEITPTSTSNTTAVDAMTREDPATAADAGKTLTISANLHLEAEQTGTLWFNARRIVVRTRTNGATNTSFAQSMQAENEAGTTRISVTFTLPDQLDWWYFLLTNGSSTVPVYWDALMIEEGDTATDYFDGDSPRNGDLVYDWAGVPHASESVEMRAVPQVPFFPIVLASSTVDGAYVLNISGDAECWPTWNVTGPGEDLLIENVTTGERIFISGEFGENVTIDTKNGDIYSDTYQHGELWKRVSLDSVLFPLAPGENRVIITMVNARPNSEVVLTYQETWKAGH